MSIFQEILKQTNAKPTGSSGGFVGRCPTHNDTHNSLSIKENSNPNKFPLLYCHAGCSFEKLRNFFLNVNSSRSLYE